MTPLRQRMIQDLQLRGYAECTVRSYVRPVVQLAQFYHRSPDQLTEEEVRQYVVHLTTVRKVAREVSSRVVDWDDQAATSASVSTTC
jgi:integrase/recombinase XerD